MDRTLLFRVALLLALVGLAACSGDDPLGVHPDGPTWTGTVAEAPLADQPQSGATLVWITVNPPGAGETIGAVIRPTTVILVRSGLGFASGTVGDLEPGDDVRIWSDGVEYFSTPPMFEVTRVEVW